ncbi:MAG: transcriptional repressor [Nitrospiraceae bacterium]
MPTSKLLLSASDEIRSRFRQAKLRLTPQREAIYVALVGTDTHPSADELLAMVRKTTPSISANTVYYTLAALRRAGLVAEVNYGHERARFDGNIGPHHHAVCQGCRHIVDIEDRGLDRLAPALVRDVVPEDFEVVAHRVDIFGLCATCRRQAQPRIRRGGSHRNGSSVIIRR